MFSVTTVVKCASGLRGDLATRFIEKANGFHSGIWIEAEGHKLNAKSMLGVLNMAIVAGTEVTISADGADEKEAVNTLVELLAQN